MEESRVNNRSAPVSSVMEPNHDNELSINQAHDPFRGVTHGIRNTDGRNHHLATLRTKGKLALQTSTESWRRRTRKERCMSDISS